MASLECGNDAVRAKRVARSKPRKGTANKGQDYEILLPALFSLRFLQDPEIKDFVLRTNVEDFGSFDDLLISLYKNEDQVENYAFQLKHKEKQNLLLPPQCLEAESRKNNFGILKYCEDFSKINERESYRFLLYTNAYFDSNELHKSKLGIICKGECPGKKYFFLPSTDDNDITPTADIYNFQFNNNNKITNLAVEEVYKSFFKKFAFYTDQKNYQDVQELLIKTFNQIFLTTDDSVALAYIDIFKIWKLHEYTHVELSKQNLRIKIFELIFSPYIIVPSVQNFEITNFTLLNTTFRKFDCVLISGLDDASVKNIVTNPHFEDDEDILYLAKELKLLTKNIIKKNIVDREMEIKQKIGYYRKETPMILKIDAVNANIIAATIKQLKKKGDKYHFVLSGKSHLLKTNLLDFMTFETLQDLYGQANYLEIIKNLKIFLNEKQYYYSDLFGDKLEVTKKVTIKDMFEMLCGKFKLEVRKEKLQEPYIPRSLSITVIKIESIDEIVNDVVVISHYNNFKMTDSLKSVINRQFVKVSTYLEQKTYSANVVLYQDKILTDDLFEEICKKNFTRNVHHFSVYDEEFLQWISTKGNITELKKCEILERKYVNQSEVYKKFQNSVNVIVANPGMGKSELLKNFKNTYPSEFFGIMINLKEHDTFLKIEHESQEILDYFVKEPNDNFFLSEIKINFAKNKSLVFFFDGLDELQHEFIDPCLKQIRKLSRMGFKIWLTSRTHLKDVIEEYFNVFSIDIKPFTDEEQMDYIRGRLKDKDNVESLTKQIFGNIDTILENRDILDLPLQLFFFTEILQEFSNEVTSNMFILTSMFRYFFSGRYRNYFKKCKCEHWESLKKIVNDSKLFRLRQYQICALKSCLGIQEFQDLNLKLDETFVKQIETDGDFLGIVLKITSGTVIFHHNITATYLAALWFTENFPSIRELFLKKILFKEEHIYLRLMFDMILAEDFPGHIAVLYRDVKAVLSRKNEINKIDRGGRSTLHLACSHGCRYSIIKDIQYEIVNVEHIKNMRNIDQQSRSVLEILLKNVDLFETDNVFEWNCLDFCENSVYLLPLEMLLENKDNAKFGKPLNVVFDMALLKNHRWTVLYYSAIFSYGKLFQSLFEQTNLEPKEATFLLQTATMWNSWKIVQILLDNGVDIHTKTKYGRTVLHLASAMGHIELVTLLRFKEADVNAEDHSGRTPLHHAAANGHFLVVKKLLEEGANVDAEDKYVRTPLHLAAEKGNEKIIKFLLDEKCAQINKTAWNGWGALQLAIMEGHVNIVKLLLNKNADSTQTDGYGTIPLHIAAKRPNIELLRILHEKTGNVDAVSSDGRTSMHVAAENGNVKAIKYLLKEKANINASDRSGRSVLHWAVIAKQPDVVHLLLKNNVDVNVADANGRNCLQWAAEGGNLEIVQLLLGKMKKLIDEKAKNGSTALHWAVINGNNDVVCLLLSAGANRDSKDNQGRTALQWAALENHANIVNILLNTDVADVSRTK